MELYTSHGAIISTAMLLVSDSILGKLYTYTPDGIRSSKTVNGTKTEYLLNGTQILAQKTGSDVMWFFYDSTGTRIGVQQGNVTAYYMYNLQGDVVGLADAATGKIIAKYLYDAWGKCVSVENADGYTIGTANPFRYRGYYYDNETGFYYLNSRYYNPEVGRFINADDTSYLGTDGTPLSYNLFAYCKNNPVMYVDPTGHFLISTAVLIGAIVGGIIGAAVGGVSAYNVAKSKGAEGWELAGWTALGAVGGGAIGAAVGAAAGYGVGYLAGGTYANGLAAKSVDSGVKAFMSQANKVHHVLSKAGHNLSGYTAKSMGTLMKKTLINGVVGPYKSVQSAYWAVANSEVSFTIVKGVLKVSDMWIR